MIWQHLLLAIVLIRVHIGYNAKNVCTIKEQRQEAPVVGVMMEEVVERAQHLASGLLLWILIVLIGAGKLLMIIERSLKFVRCMRRAHRIIIVVAAQLELKDLGRIKFVLGAVMASVCRSMKLVQIQMPPSFRPKYVRSLLLAKL